MKKIIGFLILGLMMQAVSAQKMKGPGKDYFQPIYMSFARKKPATVFLKNGKRLKGYIRNVRTKGWLITHIILKDPKTGEKRKISAEEIKEFYAYPMAMERFFAVMDVLNNANKMMRTNLKEKYFKDGAVYYQNVYVSRKNRKQPREYLLQLLNPTFSRYIEVFANPSEKYSQGNIGLSNGPQLSGGLEHTYYVRKGEETFFLKKSQFKKQYERLFGDNPEFMRKYPAKKAKWKYFSQYVLEYTRMRARQEDDSK